MTIAYWCVLLAALLPYTWTMVAKATTEFQVSDNAAPRQFLENQTGFRQRANWAQLNAFEAFPAFAAAVIIAHAAGNMEQALIDSLAVTFIVARLMHGVFYVTNLHPLRTLAWVAGMGIMVSLFILSA